MALRTSYALNTMPCKGVLRWLANAPLFPLFLSCVILHISSALPLEHRSLSPLLVELQHMSYEAKKGVHDIFLHRKINVIRAHEYLLEKLHGHSKLLIETVNTLFRELTVLGFISLVLFVVTRTGVIQSLNDVVFGEDVVERAAKEELVKEGESIVLAPTILSELFEDIHIFIFLIMSLFLIIVVFQIGIAMRQRSTWRSFESRNVRERQIDVEQGNSIDNELEFWIFHWRFLHPTTLFPAVPHSPADFPFYEYLSEKMDGYLLEMVDIPWSAWLILFLITLLARPSLDFPPLFLEGFLSYCALMMLMTCIFISHTLKNIKKELRPPLSQVKSFLLFLGDSGETTSPGAAPIDESDFIQKNGTIQTIIQNVEYINSQEALFPFGSKGPGYLLSLIQLTLFLNVVICTLLLRAMISHRHGFWFSRSWIYLMNALPLFVCMGCFILLWPRIIRDFTLCTSLHLFTDRKVVEKIDKRFQSDKRQRNISILDYLRRACDSKQARPSDADREELETLVKQWVKELPNSHYKFYVNLFHTFSKRGKTMDFGTVTQMIVLVTKDALSKDQMIGTASKAKECNASEQDLFDYVDVDGDGLITLDDLEETLKGLHPPLQKSDLKQLLLDIAEYSGQQVTRDMFNSWRTQVEVSLRKNVVPEESVEASLSIPNDAPVEHEL